MIRRLLSPWPAPLFVVELGMLIAPGCGRQHGLGVESTTGTTGAGTSTGSGGAGGAGSGGSTSGSAAGGAGAGGAPASTSTSAGTGGKGGAEPAGPTQLTIVNGVNDYDAIKICFLPYPDGDPSATPYPGAPGGLPFARAVVVNPIDMYVPPNVDVRPHLIAGDLSQIAGKTCGQVLALAAGDPSPIVVTPLAVLPAQVFTSNRSLLLTPIGCMGGPGHDGPNATLACGFTYSLANPTASILALGMSRKNDPFHMTFQVVNASTALQPSDVGLRPGFSGSTDVVVATNVSTGEISPKPPFMDLAVDDLGPIDQVTVDTFLPMQQQMFLTSSTPLSEAFAHGTVPMIDFDDGAGLVLVAVGGYPGVDPGGIWHKLTFSMVKADP